MGNQISINKISYEDIQFILKNPVQTLIISTLDHESQNCLIPKTIKMETEVTLINTHLTQKQIRIVVYGRNCNDEVYIKNIYSYKDSVLQMYMYIQVDYLNGYVCRTYTVRNYSPQPHWN